MTVVCTRVVSAAVTGCFAASMAARRLATVGTGPPGAAPAASQASATARVTKITGMPASETGPWAFSGGSLSGSSTDFAGLTRTSAAAPFSRARMALARRSLWREARFPSKGESESSSPGSKRKASTALPFTSRPA